VRFGALESVNHSKFLVADGNTTLIGSHFKRLHDLSLEVESREVAARCAERVDQHFSKGE